MRWCWIHNPQTKTACGLTLSIMASLFLDQNSRQSQIISDSLVLWSWLVWHMPSPSHKSPCLLYFYSDAAHTSQL